MLEKALAASDASEEEQKMIMKELELKETEYMRLKRHKISVDDFELLTIIGRGAFGEVLLSIITPNFRMYIDIIFFEDKSLFEMVI